MSFAGVSVIANGKLQGAEDFPTTAASASGYHLLVVEGHSRTVLPPNSSSILSRYFTIGGHRWCIFYDPDGNDGFISLELCHADSEADPVKVQLGFSFVEETDKQEPARIHASKIFEVAGCSIVPAGYERFMARKALERSKHLKDDCFTIRCDVVVLNPTCKQAPPIIAVPPSDMQRNFADLLLDGEGADVVFRFAGETFAAHRCVLAARSTVFRALLFGPMKEGPGWSSTPAVVQVDDMEPAVFKLMLGFIYGDSLPAMKEESEDEEAVLLLLQHLLVAADRYNLSRLRLMCEKKLCEHIGVGSTTTILALAEQHSCDGLKKACYEFLQCPENLSAAVDTKGFDHLCRSCPSVIKEMFFGMMPPKSSSK